MKKRTYIALCLLCTACIQEPIPSSTLLETLGDTPDPLQIIEVYISSYSKCDSYGRMYVYSCEEEIELAEPDIKFECTQTADYDYTNQKQNFANTSDECILYRRSEKFHESKVNYFDYKRFLGATSPIKTDDDFLKLVERYKSISECDELTETTTIEKEACKEKKRNEIRKLAKQSVPCMNLVKDEYIKKLQDMGEWYLWAINHDPNEQVNLMRAIGEYEAARWVYSPVWGRTEAREEVKYRITEFGQENFCTTNDWKAEIKKLGFNLY